MSARLQRQAPVLRTLRPDDVETLLRIETASYPYPWTRGILTDCIALGCPAMGLEVQGRLVGYVILSWGAGEAHLLNLCVDRPWRDSGFGSLLLEHAIQMATDHQCATMFLEVRPSNTGAVRLYQRRGFTQVGVRRGYYPADDGREDALVLRLDLERPAETPANG